MAAQTIRDVLIKIRLEQQDNKLNAPDLTAFNAAMEQARRQFQEATTIPGGLGGSAGPRAADPAKEADRRAKAEEAAYDREAKAAMDAYSRIMRERERMAEQERRIQAETAKYAASIDPTGGKVLTNSAARMVRDMDQYTMAADAAKSANLQLMQSVSGVGESALRAARGIAFLTAANEDDLRVAMQYVARMQGYLDLYAGITGAIVQLANARRAAAAAATAQAAAEALSARASISSAAATTASGVATSGAASGFKFLASAASLANPVVIGLTAAAALGSIAWATYQNHLSEVNQEFDVFAKLANEMAALEGKLTGVTEEVTARLSVSSLTSDLRQRLTEVQTTEQQLQRQTSALGPTGVTIDNDIGRQERLQQLKVEMTQQSGRQQILREILSIEDQIIAQKNRELQVAQQIISSARQQVDAEESRLKTLDERIGRLNRGEQARLRVIADQVQAGKELSRQNAEFLDRTGVGQAVASDFFRRQGQAAGSGAITSALGEQKALEQAQQNLRAAMAGAGEELKDIADEIVEAERKRKVEAERLQDVFRASFITQTEFERITEIVEKLARDQKNKSSATAFGTFKGGP